MPKTADEVRKLAVAVANARRRKVLARDRVTAIREANVAAFIEEAEAGASLTRLENELREEAVGYYTGLPEAEQKTVKEAAPGVAIEHEIHVEYDERLAVAWARQHAAVMVHTEQVTTFDRKAFETYAKAHQLPFVTIDRVPKASIAKDLWGPLGIKEEGSPPAPDASGQTPGVDGNGPEDLPF